MSISCDLLYSNSLLFLDKKTLISLGSFPFSSTYSPGTMEMKMPSLAPPFDQQPTHMTKAGPLGMSQASQSLS